MTSHTSCLWCSSSSLVGGQKFWCSDESMCSSEKIYSFLNGSVAAELWQMCRAAFKYIGTPSSVSTSSLTECLEELHASFPSAHSGDSFAALSDRNTSRISRLISFYFYPSLQLEFTDSSAAHLTSQEVCTQSKTKIKLKSETVFHIKETFQE